MVFVLVCGFPNLLTVVLICWLYVCGLGCCFYLILGCLFVFDLIGLIYGGNS